MKSYKVQRMQTNTDWAQSFKLVNSANAAIDLSGYTLTGRAKLANNVVELAEGSGIELIAGTGRFAVSINAASTEALGAGSVEIEILRAAPAPSKSLLRFKITNYKGLA